MLESDLRLNDPGRIWMNIRNEIKSYIAAAGFTMRQLVAEINERKNQDLTPNNFTTKLAKETLRYKDAKMVAEILGYELVWVKKKPDNKD